ncbi:Adenylate cyclase [Paramagnetospirillum magnetotacticum MS-1]|uniref:Adenylate cyclase n=1 Tax=Paramagnetospirillum magnetotacticum MS-1 TaxID=272627 RepID=A0A0C2YYH6_PARME|nr:adenylate/guanylate cyclase domain-containing protein [Paramagnetospirillum magnetotacticum]KIM00124.1 Adenylate cyclase [Paramagnetospirillum magnetotacticum MS-1]
MVALGIRADLRLAGALVLLAFVICHLVNHMLVLVSLDAAMAGHEVLMEPWESAIGSGLLLTAGLTHYANALWAVYERRTLRMGGAEMWQLALGLTIPFLMVVHLSGTKLGEEVLGLDPSYPSVLLSQWVVSPWKGAIQGILVLVVWGHACSGLHLRYSGRDGYERAKPWLLALAVAVPTLSLAGWISGGTSVIRSAADPAWTAKVLAEAHMGPTTPYDTLRLILMGVGLHLLLIITPFTGRLLRRLGGGKRPQLTHSSGRVIRMMPGSTVLEALQDHAIAHASACGGKGRCTTCRVRVRAGHEFLPVPESLEATALGRIEAPPEVRLACQLRPDHDLAILPLLPSDAVAADGRLHGGLDGRERHVVVVFIDLRGSTTLGEAKMPYDMLFILHRFFQQMTRALAATGGHYSNFTGDGLMALYGLKGNDPAKAVAAAMEGAREMVTGLDKLNAELAMELDLPLRMGIGIHYGQAIVGTMGPPGAQIVSAIGDTVNTAARLEGLTKDHDCLLVLSAAAAQAGGLSFPDAPRHQVAVKGRVEAVEFYAFPEIPGR